MAYRRFLVYFVLFVGVTAAAWGQLSTASLRGTALDPNGAAVPGAVIRIENAATGVVERTLTTDDNGNYAAEGLPPGLYKISTRKEGFKTQVRQVDVQVERVVVVDWQLTLARTCRYRSPCPNLDDFRVADTERLPRHVARRKTRELWVGETIDAEH